MSRRIADVARLRALEAAGASFSRNRDYAFYSQAGNGRARHLRRFLRTLAEEIRDAAADPGRCQLSLGPVEDGETTDTSAFRLTMADAQLGYRRQVNLSRAELAYVADLLGHRPAALFAVLDA